MTGLTIGPSWLKGSHLTLQILWTTYVIYLLMYLFIYLYSLKHCYQCVFYTRAPVWSHESLSKNKLHSLHRPVDRGIVNCELQKLGLHFKVGGCLSLVVFASDNNVKMLWWKQCIQVRRAYCVATQDGHGWHRFSLSIIFKSVLEGRCWNLVFFFYRSPNTPANYVYGPE